jgi:catechol 2,3-dioxygenase-like lactoylglutathione lyase family enzyme
MIKAKRIGHASFTAADLDQEIDHYREVVGLHLIDREPSRAFLATNSGQLAVVLEQGSHNRCARLSFEVSPALSLSDMARELSSLGLQSEVRSDDIPGLATVLEFTDTKGTKIELFSEPRFVPKGPAAGGAIAIKLGHLAFAVPDPRATAAFYEQVLGFRVSDWIGDYFVFLRCGPDHHTVNFIRGSKAQMHHIAFEMRDTAHLHNCLDQLGQKRVEILWGPVRHGPGHNIAAYHLNPAGHMVEFFAELDRMSDEENDFFDPRPWHRDLPQRPKVWDPKLQRDMWGVPATEKFINFAK